MTTRIVVTGIGATSPLGGNVPDNWTNLLAGVSGARTLDHDWVEETQLPVTFAAEAVVRPEEVLARPVAKRLDPSSQFALIAAMEAWKTPARPRSSLSVSGSTSPPASGASGRCWTRGTPCVRKGRVGCCR